jgi:glyoxylase-like metal-dependent hydrolase (beta-lactamase superfamily II)
MNEISQWRAAYKTDNFLPLQEQGVLDFIEGDTDIAPGVRTWVTGGHTRTHQAVLLTSNGARAIYLADLVPTTSHLKIVWNMAYDLFPIETMQRKAALLPRLVEENWLCIFEHDPFVSFARLTRRDDGTLEAAPVRGA